MNQIHRLGFGAWQLANPLWSNMTEQEAIALVRKAYDKGIRFFDTAPGYSHGQSERIIGKALHHVREHVIIQSKFGHHADGHTDFSEAIIKESIKASCERLQTDYLDSVLLHNPEPYILEGKANHFNVLEGLKQEGLISGYGASVDNAKDMILVLEHSKATHIEVLFNIFFQDARKAFQKAAEKGVKIIVKVPLDSGWLTGKYGKNSTFAGIRSRWSPAEIQTRGELVEQLRKITGEQDLVKIAMGFIWSYPEVSLIIPGIKNEAQLNRHVEATHMAFDMALRQKLEAFYDHVIKDKNLKW